MSSKLQISIPQAASWLLRLAAHPQLSDNLCRDAVAFSAWYAAAKCGVEAACKVSGRICLSCIPTVFRLLRQRPLVGRGTRRDGLASHLRLNYGRFEPFNPSVDVFQRIGIHR